MAEISDLLRTIQTSLQNTKAQLPETDTLQPPEHGISLLNVKNELLLSYIHNLVFFVILRLRNMRTKEDRSALTEQVRRQLVELRIYAEKGLRPLERKLRVQLDRLIASSVEADAVKAQAQAASITTRTAIADTNLSDSNSDSASESDGEEEDNSHMSESAVEPPITDLSYRPNPAALSHPTTAPAGPSRSSTSTTTKDPKARSEVYVPPRITPIAPPSKHLKSSSRTDSDQSRSNRTRKSNTLDTFIREEMHEAPLAEPSIGAPRSTLKGKDREREAERREYEESRLVRLPEVKRRDGRRKDDMRDHGDGRSEFDLTGLGSIGRVDLKGSGKRKRGGDGDGDRGTFNRVGPRVGERWAKKVENANRRKR